MTEVLPVVFLDIQIGGKPAGRIEITVGAAAPCAHFTPPVLLLVPPA